MKIRKGKIPVYIIGLIAIISLLFFAIEELNKVRVDDPYLEEKLKAAEVCNEAFSIIRDARDTLGIPIDLVNDPNATGLIGPQYSLITEGMGNLTEKLTTLNPNFAATIVDMLKKSRLKSGDVIGIGWTGSYPAINIALLSACEALELRPIIVTSVGSSMWGANIPSLTWLDMERILNERGLFPFSTTAASIGGRGDIGIGLSPEGRSIIEEKIDRSGAYYIDADNIKYAIDKRIQIFGDSIRTYVNVGWGVASIGEENEDLKPGVNLKTRRIKLKGPSVAERVSNRGIPIINLVSFEKLANRYELPIAPVPLPPVGEGSLYFKDRYSIPLAIIFILIIITILFICARYEIEHIFRRR